MPVPSALSGNKERMTARTRRIEDEDPRRLLNMVIEDHECRQPMTKTSELLRKRRKGDRGFRAGDKILYLKRQPTSPVNAWVNAVIVGVRRNPLRNSYYVTTRAKGVVSATKPANSG